MSLLCVEVEDEGLSVDASGDVLFIPLAEGAVRIFSVGSAEDVFKSA